MSNNPNKPDTVTMSVQPSDKKREGMSASAKLTKETHNSLVYTSILGQSLYFNKQLFDGQKPEKLIIQLSWS